MAALVSWRGVTVIVPVPPARCDRTPGGLRGTGARWLDDRGKKADHGVVVGAGATEPQETTEPEGTTEPKGTALRAVKAQAGRTHTVLALCSARKGNLRNATDNV